jgi:outer membrane receptor protein involved in Fe transport
LSKRATLIAGAQFRRTSDQPVQELRSSVLLPPDQPSVRVRGEREVSEHVLPYLSLAYDVGKGGMLRLWGNENLVRLGGPLLAPSEAFLDNYPLNLFFNGRVENYGTAYERRFGARTFARGFWQYGLAHNFLLSPSVDESFEGRGLQIPEVQAQILGARLEHQLNRNLSLFTDLRYQDVTDQSDRAYLLLATQTPSENFGRGQQVPLVPRWQGLMGMNYVDSSGTKLRLSADLLGPRYTDVGLPGSNGFGTPIFNPSAPRPKAGSSLFLDLQIGKEPSVGLEYSLTITNLLNSRTLDWPGYPTRGRRFLLSVARRF